MNNARHQAETVQAVAASIRGVPSETLICGRLPVGKGILDGYAALVGAAICPAFGCGALRWPLAIMLSADQVPVKTSQS
jgi:hypothetical protein